MICITGPKNLEIEIAHNIMYFLNLSPIELYSKCELSVDICLLM